MLKVKGQKYRMVLAQCGFQVDTIVTLQHLDEFNDNIGLFSGDNTQYQNAQDVNGKRIPGAWANFDHMELYVEAVIHDEYVPFVEGVSYKVITQGDHSHWGFKEGATLVATRNGLESPSGYFLRAPFSTMKFEVLGVLFDIKPSLAALKDLQEHCHNVSVKAGWWHDVTTGEPFDATEKGPEKIALMHSELSEALEGLRKGLMDDKLPHRPNAEVELADAVIRILDWAGAMGYDIAGAIGDKLEYNANREDHKLANRQAAGGKKF